MSRNSANPLIVQGDRTILVEVDNPRYADARDALARFAELEKSPEHIHTYRITPLSLWNAAAAGLAAAEAVDVLERFGKYPLPGNVRADIFDYVSRYGRLKLVREDNQLLLVSDDRPLLVEVQHHPRLAPLIIGHRADGALVVQPAQRGHIKHALIQLGYPAEDLAGYVDGARLEVALRSTSAEDGVPFALRGYQRDAAAAFHAAGSARGGSGVIVLPCGAGKTLVGLAVMAGLQCHTLILTPSIVAARQWIREILDKTSVPSGSGRRVQRRAQRRPADHHHDLPGTYLPPRPRRSVPPLRAVRRARLGPDRVRRSAPAPSAGLPHHR